MDGVRDDISNPPVAAYCIWKIFQMTGETALLDEAYASLLHWHDWWLNFRDGNHNQLLSWGAPEETGMPGHPLYENAARDERTGLLQLDDVGLCSLWALDAFALMRMALQLNDLDQATHLEREIVELADRMNMWFWDPGLGQFRSRTWDGMAPDSQSITSLLVLPGRIPTLAHVQRLVNEHLDFEFDTEFVVPTVGSGDSAFGEQLPWRGRISPLLNYLICEGLRHFGKDEWAEHVTLSGLELITRSWQHHAVFDSYNAITGRGDDLAQGPLAPAGLLFSALGIGMSSTWSHGTGCALGICAAPRWRSPGHDAAALAMMWSHHPPVCKSPATARSGARLTPVIIRNLTHTAREMSLQAKLEQAGPLRLRFHGFAPPRGPRAQSERRGA